jgi:hypothetical protein
VGSGLPNFWQKFFTPLYVVTVARVHLPMVNTALLGFLPTPAKSTKIPPVPLAKSPATTYRLGYANAVERWDAHKNKVGSLSPSSPRPASSSPRRAPSCDRWNTNKKSPSICVGRRHGGQQEPLPQLARSQR